jgi:hypothetical protein
MIILSLSSSTLLGVGDGVATEVPIAGGALQHVTVSAAAVQVVPVQSALFLLESLTFGEVQAVRVEHFEGVATIADPFVSAAGTGAFRLSA